MNDDNSVETYQVELHKWHTVNLVKEIDVKTASSWGFTAQAQQLSWHFYNLFSYYLQLLV